MCKVAAYNPTHNKNYYFSNSRGKAEQYCLLYIVPIMIGLKIADMERYSKFINGFDYKPLVEVSDCLGERFFEDLLNVDETYYPEDSSRKLVTLDNKLKEVYESIFNTSYGSNIYSKTVGKLEFDENNKRELLRVVGLLSRYTSISD